MTTFTYVTPTSDQKDSHVDVLGHLMPARAFFFVVVDEPGRDGFLTRRCYTAVNSSYLDQLNLSPLERNREVFPERYGLWGKGGPNAHASIVDHVMAYEKLTSYVSTSSQFPAGTGRMEGKIVYVDIAKAKRSGARLVQTSEIELALKEYAQQNPHVAKRVARISEYVVNIDKEVLLQPKPMIPPSGIFTKQGLAVSLGIVKYARVVEVIGIVFTAYDLAAATDRSFRARSVRPIEKETVRQAGGWGGMMAGARIGGATGALVGLETGPGTIITGLIGGIVFGAIGYFGGRTVADHIPDN